jgi:hypothetical protein
MNVAMVLVFVSMLALTQRWCAPAEDEAPVKLAVMSSILLIIPPNRHELLGREDGCDL